jgi:hypothetical protein
MYFEKLSMPVKVSKIRWMRWYMAVIPATQGEGVGGLWSEANLSKNKAKKKCFKDQH